MQNVNADQLMNADIKTANSEYSFASSQLDTNALIH